MSAGDRIAASLAVATLAGCASAPADAGFSDVARQVDERAGIELQWLREDDADRESSRRADARVHALLEGALSAATAVQIALLRNAGLQATLEELGVARADLLEAGLAANPLFEAELRFPAAPRSPLEVHVIEDFLSVLSMPLRRRVAEARFEQTKLRVAEEVLHLVAEVKRAVYEAQAAEALLEARRTFALSASAAAEAAQQMHDAGNFGDLQRDERLAQDGQARLDLAVAEAECFERRSALDALLGLWGAETAWKLASPLPPLPEQEVAADRLESIAIARRLDVAIAREEIDVQARALGLVRATSWLDSLDLGAHWEREPDGQSTVGPSIGIPLPLFSRGPSARERGEARLRQAEQRYRALAIAARAQTRSLAARLLTARRRVEYLRDVFVPLHARIVEQSQLQYNAMQIGVFELLHAKNEEIGAGVRSSEALRDYWLARAQLEEALGGSVELEPERPRAGGE